MTNHIDTNNFIKAVGEHPCLWNASLKDYSDKYVKQESWYQIGEQFFEGWSDMSSEARDSKVIILQKKWRAIRDYYVRTLRRYKHNTSKLDRMLKNNEYFINLAFLDNNITQTRRPSVTASEEHYVYVDEAYLEDNIRDESESSEFILNEASTSNEEVPEKKPKLRETYEMDSLVSNVSDSRDEASNKYFLLSLLPDMASMSERQNFKFRMEIMKALDRVKY